MVLVESSYTVQEVLVSHSNAILTPAGRLKLARCVVDAHLPLRRAAERFNVSVPTAAAGRDAMSSSGKPACSIVPADH